MTYRGFVYSPPRILRQPNSLRSVWISRVSLRQQENGPSLGLIPHDNLDDLALHPVFQDLVVEVPYATRKRDLDLEGIFSRLHQHVPYLKSLMLIIHSRELKPSVCDILQNLRLGLNDCFRGSNRFSSRVSLVCSNSNRLGSGWRILEDLQAPVG
ncbi:hypothetical protein C8J56DRAFT_161266 [Mycena floridula]|nr:hypothetical protein C8J56DRAFT_161266 [Mycena floridula]